MRRLKNQCLKLFLAVVVFFSGIQFVSAMDFFADESMIRNATTVSEQDGIYTITVANGYTLPVDEAFFTLLEFYNDSYVESLMVSLMPTENENVYTFSIDDLSYLGDPIAIAEGEYHLALGFAMPDSSETYALTSHSKVYFKGVDFTTSGQQDYSLSCLDEGETYQLTKVNPEVPDLPISESIDDYVYYGLTLRNEFGSYEQFRLCDLELVDGNYIFHADDFNNGISYIPSGFYDVHLYIEYENMETGFVTYDYDVTDGNPVYFEEPFKKVPEGATLEAVEEGLLITTSNPLSEDSQAWFDCLITHQVHWEDVAYYQGNFTQLEMHAPRDYVTHQFAYRYGTEMLEKYEDDENNCIGLLLTEDKIIQEGVHAGALQIFQLSTPGYLTFDDSQNEQPFGVNTTLEITQDLNTYDLVITWSDEKDDAFIEDLRYCGFYHQDGSGNDYILYSNPIYGEDQNASIDLENNELRIFYSLIQEHEVDIFNFVLYTNTLGEEVFWSVPFENGVVEEEIAFDVHVSETYPYDIIVQWDNQKEADFIHQLECYKMRNDEHNVASWFMFADSREGDGNAWIDEENQRLVIFYHNYSNFYNGIYSFSLVRKDGNTVVCGDVELKYATQPTPSDIEVFLTSKGFVVKSQDLAYIESLNRDCPQGTIDDNWVTVEFSTDPLDISGKVLRNSDSGFNIYEGVYEYEDGSGYYYTYLSHESLKLIGLEDDVNYSPLLYSKGYRPMFILEDDSFEVNQFINIFEKMEQKDAHLSKEELTSLDDELMYLKHMEVIQMMSASDKVAIFGAGMATAFSDNQGGLAIENLAYENGETMKVNVNIQEKVVGHVPRSHHCFEINKGIHLIDLTLTRQLPNQKEERITQLPIPVLIEVKTSHAFNHSHDLRVVAKYEDGTKDLLEATYQNGILSFYTSKSGEFILVEGKMGKDISKDVDKEIEKLPEINHDHKHDVQVGVHDKYEDHLHDIADSVIMGDEHGKIENDDSFDIKKELEEFVDKGKNPCVKVEITVEKMEEDHEDKECLHEFIDQEQVLDYLDVQIVVDISVDEAPHKQVNVTEIPSPIEFTLSVPENLEEVEKGYHRVFFVLRVHTKEDGSKEVTRIELSPQEDGTYSFFTDQFSTYAFAYEDQEILYGDVNNNGIVNNQDRMILTRYLAEWTGYETLDHPVAADVNQDGQVNNKDRMILTRHLAEWTGYERLPLTQ